MSSSPIKSSIIKKFAQSLGFDVCRILPARQPRSATAFLDWLNQGMAANMDYLARSQTIRINPHLLEPKPNSVLVLAKRYPLIPTPITTIPEKWRHDSRFGWIARYAWGVRDYHNVLRKPLIALDQTIRAISGRSEPAKGWIDRGPVLERDLAEQAGIGFIGKNTCAIHSEWGSWFFLASLWLPEVFDYDSTTEPRIVTQSDDRINMSPLKWTPWDDPHPPTSRVGSCGRCSRCIDMCPTKALTPYQLDARKCIAYWTIEAKDEPPVALEASFGQWIFGCDVCQDVCPWNAEKATNTADSWETYAYPHGPLLILDEGLQTSSPYLLDDAAFLQKFQGTPIMRTGRLGLLRNINRVKRNINKRAD